MQVHILHLIHVFSDLHECVCVFVQEGLVLGELWS